LRGIIATAAQVNLHTNGFSFDARSGGLSENDIKYFLLYWDKIVIPANNFIYAGIPYEEDLLKAEIIERPIIQLNGIFSGSELGQSLLFEESKIVEEKLKDRKVDWSIHQFSDELILPDNRIKEKKVFKFELMGILPVPQDDVHIHEIIEFKERRKDEFVELHNTLDDLYFDILESPDADLTASKHIDMLKNALNNIEKVQKEKFKTFSKYDLTTELNINGKDILQGIIAGGIIDWKLGTQIPFGTIIGGIAPMLKMSLKKSITFSSAEKKLHLSYLSRAKKEKILI